jgi:DNA-binding PadR family transcriptional regulator
MEALAQKKTAGERPATAAGPAMPPGQASKIMMVLGLLKGGPRHGYELHRIVVAHGSIYADFKKPTLYHLLHRLALQGAVQVRSEGGARGPRGERLVFALTARGEAQFLRLLRAALSSYDTTQTVFEVAAAYLGMLPADEAQALLRQRRDVVRQRRAEMLAEIGAKAGAAPTPGMAARQLATEHAVGLMDAELAWMDRVIRRLAARGRS